MYSKKAIALFSDWDEALIWSCLQGCMGTMIVDNKTSPKSAIIINGDFCFCAGIPDENLLKSVPISEYMIIAPSSDVFDKEKLQSFVDSLDNKYEVRLFDNEVFELARSESWSADLCSQFKNYKDYQKRSIGVAILHNGNLVSGASPYVVYKNGIEIEIDTKPEYRGEGLATVCGAKLILECLANNLYPSWDAHDLRSVHLAEKLGYTLSHAYVAYEIRTVVRPVATLLS